MENSIYSAYLGLGGNLGDPVRTINAALRDLASSTQIKEVRCSSLYQTAPVSDILQPDYINAVCSLKTTLLPRALMQLCLDIEAKHGRVRNEKNGPRTVDLDLLFYRDFVYHDPLVTIPHPRWKNRLFVLVPLAELVDVISIGDKCKATTYDVRAMIREFPEVERSQIIKLMETHNR